MPKRQLVRRFDASRVQGPEAYIELSKFTWGEQKDLRNRLQSLSGDDASILEMEKLVIERLHAWNWTDENGKELQIPKTIEELKSLMSDEIAFLAESMGEVVRGALSEESRKN